MNGWNTKVKGALMNELHFAFNVLFIFSFSLIPHLRPCHLQTMKRHLVIKCI
jgi:hypothetical protein